MGAKSHILGENELFYIAFLDHNIVNNLAALNSQETMKYWFHTIMISSSF